MELRTCSFAETLTQNVQYALSNYPPTSTMGISNETINSTVLGPAFEYELAQKKRAHYAYNQEKP